MRTLSSGGFQRTLTALVPPGVFALISWLAWGGLVDGALIGVAIWLVVRLGPVRMGLLRHHGRGMAAFRDDAWEDALAAFQASERWWRAHPILDRWRAPLLGTTGPWPYLLLSLYNQALCCYKLGRGDEALRLLDQVLAEDGSIGPARELRGALLAQVARHSSGQADDWFDG